MEARDLDQFYTSPSLASDLFFKTRQLYPALLQSHTLLEPSAGTGAFSDLFNGNFVALDIDPKKPYMLKADFLSWQPDLTKRYVVIGNPPFGKNASLAIKFFNKAASFCDLIAFIVPRTFMKHSVQNKISLNMKLAYEEVIPNDSFIFNGATYSVPCCFQIWERSAQPRQIYTPPDTDDFFFTTPANADIAFQRIGVNAGKITYAPLAKDKNVNSHIFIKFKSQGIRQAFVIHDFTKYKLMTAGNPSISKSEILEIWSKR